MESCEWRESLQEAASFEELLEKTAYTNSDTNGVDCSKLATKLDLEFDFHPLYHGEDYWQGEEEADSARVSGNEAYQARFLYVAWQEYTRALLCSHQDATAYANRAQVSLQLARCHRERSPSVADDWLCQALRDTQQAWLCLGGALTSAGQPDWTFIPEPKAVKTPRQATLPWKVCLRFADAARRLGRLEEAREAMAVAERIKPRPPGKSDHST